MKIHQQLKRLREEALDNGLEPIVMEKAINPVLEMHARVLKHANYYVLEGETGEYLITTLVHKIEGIEKTVIYAFARPGDAREWKNEEKQSLSVSSIPVTHLIFRLLALEEVDSIIFLDNYHIKRGYELYRSDLKDSIKKMLEQLPTINPTYLV